MGTLGVLTIGRIVMTLRIRMKTVPSCIRQVSYKKNVLQGFSMPFIIVILLNSMDYI